MLSFARNAFRTQRLGAIVVAVSAVTLSTQACDDRETDNPCEPVCGADECGEQTRCGETIQCGGCNAPFACSEAGRCECTPRTCFQALANCGVIDDGCNGERECGQCEGPTICGARGEPNVCAVEEEARLCSASGWCWENPLPLPIWAEDLHATASNDAWVAARHGLILQWDGTRFSDRRLPVTDDVSDILSFGPNSAFALTNNTVWTWDGSSWSGHDFAEHLLAIDGMAANDIYLSASLQGQGTLFHWDGNAWSTVLTSTKWFNTLDVADGTVWGFDNGVYRLEGQSWVQKLPNPGDGTFVRGFYARTSEEAWVVGWIGNATIQDPFADADGFVWSSTGQGDVFPKRAFDGIVGRSDAVYAMSDGGFTTLYGTGTFPGISLDSASKESLREVVSVDESTHFAITKNGFKRFADGEWRDEVAGKQEDILTLDTVDDELFVYGSPWRGALIGGVGTGPSAGYEADNVWGFIGQRLAHWTGEGWTIEHQLSEYLNAISVDGNGGYWVAGNGIYSFDGTSPVVARPEGDINYTQIALVGGEPWLIGNDFESGVLTRRINGQWADERLPDSAQVQIRGFVVLAENDVWVVGFRGNFGNPNGARLYHYDGNTWTTTVPESTDALYAIAARNPNEIYAVGTRGTIMRFDGSQWSLEDSVYDRALRAVVIGPDGDVWVSGEGGALLRKSGN